MTCYIVSQFQTKVDLRQSMTFNGISSSSGAGINTKLIIILFYLI
jgi:hypothetical protein